MDVLCQEEACNRRFYARGYCKSHYTKHRRSGVLKKLPPLEIKYCKVNGCLGIHSAQGLCQKHYRMFKVLKNPMVYKNIEKKRTQRAARHKEAAVAALGGCCSVCGYNKNIMCLDFHHQDPSKKEREPSKIMREKDLNKIMAEINKCVLVCKNCHTEIHHPEGERPVITAP